MPVEILKDKNKSFRQLRIPIPPGFHIVRVVDTSAEEIAKEIMDIDLRSFVAQVEKSGINYNSERDFRVAVVDAAIEGIREKRIKKRMEENPTYHPDGIMY